MIGIFGASILASLGTIPALPAFDLLAPDQPSASDAVVLIEATATDGTITVTSTPQVLAASILAGPVATLTGGTVTLDWSDRDWTSLPTDTRPNVHFQGRAADVTIDRALPLRPDGERRVAAALGDIGLSNADGALDQAARLLAVDGQPLTVSLLRSRASAYADRRVIFAGVGLDWRADARALRLRARDLTYTLDVPMLGTYGGTGAADGSADLEGKAIPEVWGRVRNMAPTSLGVSGAQIFQIHARQVQAINAVYVRGATVTAGVQHATYAALAAASVTAGTYDWANTATGTYIRPGSTVDGAVTVDVQGDASAVYSATIPGIMRRIITRAGGSFSAAGFANLDAICPGEAGIYLGDQLTYAEALTRLASGGVLWWGDDGTGVITGNRVAAPNGASGLLLDQTVIVDDVEVLDAPAIAWRVTAGYRRNWSPLVGNDVASGISVPRKLEFAEPQRRVAVSDAARRSRNAQALDVTIETLFDLEAEAAGVAQNVLSLMRPGLSLFRVPCNAYGLGLALGSQARLIWPRYGLANGLDVRVVGQSIRGRRADLLVIG
jgi:hypothetical protein